MKKGLLFITAVLLAVCATLVFSSCKGSDASATTDTPNQTESSYSTEESVKVNESERVDSSSDTKDEGTQKPQLPEDTKPNGADTQKPADTQEPSVIYPSEGTVRSDTSTSMNLILSYKLTQSGTKVLISYEIGLETYAISVSARSEINYVCFGDKKIEFPTDAIDYNGKSKTYIKLHEGSCEIEASGDIRVYAKWVFNGNYAGTDISSVVIESIINT